MNAQRFANANVVMKAPEGMENCADVHAYCNGEVVITAWRPTAEELVRLNLGEPVWLWIWGKTMPPVAVVAEDPWQTPPAAEE